MVHVGVVAKWNFNFDVVLLIEIFPTNDEVVSSSNDLDSKCKMPVVAYPLHGKIII